jgi:hypothetical protein
MSNLVITSLVQIPDEILIQDMNYEFLYKRIMQPNGEKSSLFNLHFKEKSNLSWTTMNGCLSENFKVIKTEEIINQIIEKLGAIISKKLHFRQGTSVKCSFILSDFTLDLPQDQLSDKIVFKLVTGIESDISVLSRAALSFNIINGFSGNRRLVLNYGFLKSVHAQVNNEDRVITSNNPFLLDEYSKNLVHDDKNLEISYAEITDIEHQVQRKIEVFKGIPLSAEWLKDFYVMFPKKFATVVQGFMEEIPMNYKNLYYLCFVLGIILDNMKNINLETRLKLYIIKYVESIVELERR